MTNKKHYVLTHLNTENTLAIFPIALILFLITSFRRFAAVPRNKNIFKYTTKQLLNLEYIKHKLD